MVTFEIGIVYKKDSRLYIAVDSSTLVTVKKGVVTEVRPNTRYKAVRSIPVEGLCEHWGITLDRLDAAMADYFAPPQTAIKTRPRGVKLNKTEDDEYWRRHRTGRIARPKL